MALHTNLLLSHLKNQLQWLQKQKYTYLNLTPLPPEACQKLTQGLHILMGVPAKSPTVTEAPLSESTQLSSLPVSSLPVSSLPGEPNNLESLRAQYCECQRCPLAATRTHFVFGIGPAQTPLLFLGEGPGAEEDRLGEPFVGKAGKLLNKMIQAIGIDRPDVYIANVVKCRPPQNRNPHAEEIAKCFPIVQRQLALINPRLIVTLGNVPTRALIPNAPGITKSRGQFYHYQNWTVLPTFHPAYLLRNPAAMEAAWQDFREIMNFCFEDASLSKF